MVASKGSSIASLITKNEDKMLSSWISSQISFGSLRSGQIKEDELRGQSRQFLREFVQALKSGQLEDIAADPWGPVRNLLGELSRSRALQGFTPNICFLGEGAAVCASEAKHQVDAWCALRRTS
jgi:rsbT co-antagonist protein RsbR